MVKRPTGPFWDASHHTPARESQLKDPFELNPPRDKDNAGHKPAPPRFAPGGGANNLAARGALGTKRDMPVPDHHKPEIDLRTEHPENKGWSYGSIVNMEGYQFAVKLSDLPSERNLDHGKIERMVVYQDKTPVVNFDRGWTVKPANARDMQAVEKVRDVFDPPERDFKPIAPKAHDKDHGHER
jgi:hypothetical protein